MSTQNPEEPRNGTNRIKRETVRRSLLTLAGLLCVMLAAAGVVLPLLPTTPFLLLAAACFARSSPKLDHWLHHNRLFGPYLVRYRRGDGLPMTAKVSILSLLWLSLASSACFAVPDRLWPVRWLLALIGVAVSIHILRIKTWRREKKPTTPPAISCPERE